MSNDIHRLYQRALKYAGEKHAGQLVPGSKANYLLHVSNVAMEILMAHKAEPNFDLAYTIQVAILHDTIEDTDATYGEVAGLFGNEVADGVMALTKDDRIDIKQEKMRDSLERILKQRPEVAMVKLADRITNLQEPPEHWSLEKRRKYLEEAGLILNELGGSNEYLKERLRGKMEEYKGFLRN